MKMGADRAMLHHYLYFGYCPRPDVNRNERWLTSLLNGQGSVPKRTYSTSSLIERGRERLLAAVAESVARCRGGELHVVPISGGLDSRAILGALLELGLGSQVQTVTFGLPGALDYDLGQKVASEAGVPHQAISLKDVPVSLNALERAVNNGAPWTYTFDAFYNQMIAEYFPSGAVYWSGFLGEALAGAHLFRTPSATWPDAVRRFADWNRFRADPALITSGDDPLTALPSRPILDGTRMEYDDQLDLAVRQQDAIRPIVVGGGRSVMTPLASPLWSSFMLSVPRDERRHSELYRRVIQAAFPHLSAVPVKNNAGLPLSASRLRVNVRLAHFRLSRRLQKWTGRTSASAHRLLNYVDFAASFRDRGDFHEVARECLDVIGSRALVPWVPIARLLKEHEGRVADHSRSLQVLCGLAANVVVEDGGQS